MLELLDDLDKVLTAVSPLDLGSKSFVAYYRLFKIVFAVFRIILDIFFILLRWRLSLITGGLNLLNAGADFVLQSNKIDPNLIYHALDGARVHNLAGLASSTPGEAVVPMDVLQELLDVSILEHLLPEEKLVLIFEYQIPGRHLLVD